jgi:dTMP kinase
VLVAFEGGEGAGKTTQVSALAGDLRARGLDVVVTQEPGGTPLGVELRRLLLEPTAEQAPSARAEALLFAADRAQHVETVVRPALARGAVVLTARYADSSTAYQGAGRGLGVEAVAALNRFATDDLVPDLTVLLDLDPAEGLRRAAAAGGTGGAPDRVEAEPLAMHEQVRAALLELAAAAPHRYVVVDASAPVGVVHVQVLAAVLSRLGRTVDS